ncbi:MAG TPA: response regulator, partial [Firmicutes bacterium]|nr:response regulator [Bacillota bacterium]
MAKILVVDDEQKIRKIVKLYLERAGFSVHEAEDGPQALDLFRRLPPDLVILDLMLPGLSGEQVCSAIRQGHDTPIIMLTAKVGEEDRVAGLECGADDYVLKPFSPKELVARVNAVLRRSGRLQRRPLASGD